MVYAGIPSAGCDNCRTAKKRCGLERPVCFRCIKKNKVCSGYRDTTKLIIRDETENVRRKAERKQAKFLDLRGPGKHSEAIAKTSSITTKTLTTSMGYGEPVLPIGPSSTVIDEGLSDGCDYNVMDEEDQERHKHFKSIQTGLSTRSVSASVNMPRVMGPTSSNIASTYFFQQFTSNGHWEFLQKFDQQPSIDPCLSLAIQACGMAALSSVYFIDHGKDYARLMYVDALALLNQALRDPKRSKLDESLIAVTLLGYYENITCDRRQSIQSWQAHIKGASQMLKLRGKKQFETSIGRQLFREIRSQVMGQCIWDYQEAPRFLADYQAELEAQTPESCSAVAEGVDKMSMLCIRFARLRARLNLDLISEADAAIQASDLEMRLIQWSKDALQKDSGFWQYYATEVDDDEHIWDGKAFMYSGHPAPTTWNSWRCVRIMLSRMQETLNRRLVPEVENKNQISYFRQVRRQMADEICATIPACLGHAGSPVNSPCVLITAYGCIWPLFFAGTCTLERVGYGAWSISEDIYAPPVAMHSSAYAQAAWILRRLRYISQHVGLRWADEVVCPLRGEFRVQKGSLDDDPIESWLSKVTTADRSPWLQKIEEAHAAS